MALFRCVENDIYNNIFLNNLFILMAKRSSFDAVEAKCVGKLTLSVSYGIIQEISSFQNNMTAEAFSCFWQI